ncbi:MAG: cytochrome c biogenesis protein DipZ [Gemmatimonadaceae bacterium]
MLLYLLVFAGGVLTILGPCILPILPMVFARSDRPFHTDGGPLLVGLATMFAVVATAATASATWVTRANEIGRVAAMCLLAAVGAALIFPSFAATTARPVTWLGRQLQPKIGSTSIMRSFLVGSAIGLLWAPCAGPILGLVVAAAVARGGGWNAALLFLTFAGGASFSMAAVLATGGRLLARIKRSHRVNRWVRPSLGAITIASVLLIASGWDRTLYARGGIVDSNFTESQLVQRLTNKTVHAGASRTLDIGESLDDFAARASTPPLADEGEMPSLDGAIAWINSPPLTRDSLRGKVVLIDFWTFGCYNCLNALPHVKALEAKYRDRGLVVIGVHTPEFSHEKVLENVKRQVRELGVEYPVPVDNDYRIWKAFNNQYWPAAYFVDRRGHIRFHHFGEGRYDEQDAVVARLLAEPVP